jgi:hypothetical protein
MDASAHNFSEETAAHNHHPDTFSIGIFYGPTIPLTNEEQYSFIRDANVDFIQFVDMRIPGEPETPEATNKKHLDLAHKYGLKFYVHDPRVKGTDEEIRAMVDTYKSHPAVAGYFVQDEPGAEALDWPAATYKKILKLDPARTPSVNLLPDFVFKDYENDYVQKWIDKVGSKNLRILSFDHYPFGLNGEFRKSYFNNLDVIRRVGLKYDIPTSFYPQSMGIAGAYRRPNKHELRYSAYSGLAYGIKNLVWFTYNTPVNQPSERFTSAIIDSLGAKTDLYEPFKNLNAELKTIGRVLYDLDAIAVYHTDSVDGTAKQLLPRDFILLPLDAAGRFIVTHFKDKKKQKDYVMIVNKSLTEEKTFSFRVAEDIRNVMHISAASGKAEKTNFKRRKKILTDRFLPGEGKLYQLGNIL